MQLLIHLNDLLQSCVTQAEAYQVITLSGSRIIPRTERLSGHLAWQGSNLETVARWGDETA